MNEHTSAAQMNAITCRDIIRAIFDQNRFVQVCGIVIDEVRCGWARLHMPIDGDVHVNPAGFVHGGAFSTLANTAIGVACCTVGAKTVTSSFNITFLRNVMAGAVVTCEATVVNRGNHLIVLSSQIKNDQGKLIAEVMCTMYVTGEDEIIPREW